MRLMKYRDDIHWLWLFDTSIGASRWYYRDHWHYFLFLRYWYYRTMARLWCWYSALMPSFSLGGLIGASAKIMFWRNEEKMLKMKAAEDIGYFESLWKPKRKAGWRRSGRWRKPPEGGGRLRKWHLEESWRLEAGGENGEATVRRRHLGIG